MASGDTKTNQYLDIAANGSRADLPTDTCCETRSQTLIREVAERIITEEETRAREDAILQDEIDELRNNPDVVDIVATYADLQAYDTSKLTDKDIIRVLSDENHDGQSTYYRYDKHNDSWTYIGEAGDYYTKTQTDELLEEKQDLLTAGDGITIEDESGALVISATGGGGGGTTNFNQLTNRPSYNGVTMTGSTNIPEVKTYTAGTNVSISAQNVISATDTTYTAGAGLTLTGAEFSADLDIKTLTSDDATGHSQEYGDYVEAWNLETGTYYKPADTAFFVSLYLKPDESDPNAEPDPTQDAFDSERSGFVVVTNEDPTDPAGSADILFILTSDCYLGAATSHDGELLEGVFRTPTVFTGASGVSDGKEGLVPAPTSAEELMFLRGDGQWATAGGGGGDVVYSDKTTSDANDGGAVYIGNKNSSQEVVGDPTTTDNHYRYFWALPINNTDIPSQRTINIGGSIYGGHNNIGNTAIGSASIAENGAWNCSSNLAITPFESPSSRGRIAPSNRTTYSVLVGSGGYIDGGGGNVGIGTSVSIQNNDPTLSIEKGSVVIGAKGICANNSSVALGACAETSRVGEVNIGYSTTYGGDGGFNNTAYRVIGGVHDGQDLHDAATKGQLDKAIINGGTTAPTTSTVGAVGTLYSAVVSNTAHLYVCTAIDDTTDPQNPSYTWTTLV